MARATSRPLPLIDDRIPQQAFCHPLVTDLQPGGSSRYEVRGRIGELSVKDTMTGKAFRVAVVNPVDYWRVLYTTVLPDGRAVFQMGGQIALLDIPARRIGLITNGRQPLVIPDEDVSARQVSGSAE